ncbi:MAG: hypothetical protein NT166_27260 [Candidatus Aminicenantes bacterium]|nr:hypothetical protein [Candidatus Aminicenantes bacterium]
MKKYFLLGLLTAMFLPVFTVVGDAAAGEETAARCNYILIFQASEYNSKMGDAVDFFFRNILKPEDHLSIITPANPYNFSPQTRQAYPIEKLVSRTQDVLKRDISVGAANYQQILDGMMQLVREISGGTVGGDIKSCMIQYRQLLANMRNLRKLNENLFMQLAGLFKKETGKNYLYIFYQEELRIIPNRKTLQRLKESSEFNADTVELFEEENSQDFLNVETVSMALKDASVTLNFIYLNKDEKQKEWLEVKEFSGDVYSVLSKLATATGGQIEATSKPEAVLKKWITPPKK